MCGIAGVWNRNGRQVCAGTLDAMTDALAHRGPDGRGIWRDGGVGLGHRRLAVRDLSDMGHQPMADPDMRVIVTYNGEIYNDDALARELARDHGLVRRSTCDTEIIPLGYLAWGTDIFRRLEGMFAIALWDAAAGQLHLVRDGIGIKPLYYHDDGTRIAFASEIKGLLAGPNTPRTVDPSAFAQFVAQGYPAPGGSLLAGVREVPPGTLCSFELKGRRDTTFWQPTRKPDITRMDEASEAVDACLNEVVPDMLVSDVPTGVLQSGGIDSTLIGSALSGSDVPLFTASFSSQDHDESTQAARIAQHAGRRHHIVPVDARDKLEDDFREMVRGCDGHLADSSSLAMLLLARNVRPHVTVALSGDGADEFFGGYPTYRATRLAGSTARALPAGLLRTLGQWCFRFNAGTEARYPLNEVLGRFLVGASDGAPACHAGWRRLVMPEEAAALAGARADRLDDTGLRPYRDALVRAGRDHGLVDAALLADQQHYLPGDMLQKVDRMSMAHSLEVRVPFLDRRMMDLAGRISPDLLTRWRSPDKRVLRHLLASKPHPPGIADAAKRGFNVPVAQLLRGPLRRLGDTWLSRHADILEPHLKPDKVRNLWHEHQTCRRNHSYLLWALLVFAVWYDDCLTGRQND